MLETLEKQIKPVGCRDVKMERTVDTLLSNVLFPFALKTGLLLLLVGRSNEAFTYSSDCKNCTSTKRTSPQ